jgi:exonuclease SbcD
MLKLLHTADLHLGKVFHDQSLIEDQRFMLDQLADLLFRDAYDALLIAGDVYDRSIPSPEAVGLFSAFLGRVKGRRPSPEVLILPGNHDSSSRLGFGKELFAELGIHFVTSPEDADKPVMVGAGEDRAAFFLLPFLYPGSLREEGAGGEAEPIRSQGKLAEAAAARLEQARRAAGTRHTVLGAHLFIAGGIGSESERVFLGNAEGVGAELFRGFDYVGLGHLHRFQQAGERAWYSGSPLAYSFEEGTGDKVFLSVELEGAQAPRVSPIPVRPLRKLRSLRGPFSHFFRDQDPALTEAEGDYLEISLTGRSLVENPLALLRRRFPRLLSVRQDEALAAFAEGMIPLQTPGGGGGERRSPGEDFADFLAEIYGQADDEKIRLFGELLAAAEGDAGEEPLL